MNKNEINFKIYYSLNDCQISNESFKNSVQIYINKPQVVNRWLAGSIDIPSNNEDDKSNQSDDIIKIEYKEFIAKNNKIFQNIKYKISHFNNSLILFESLDTIINDTKTCSITTRHAFSYDQLNRRINLYLPTDLKELEGKKDKIYWLTHTLLPKFKNWSLNVNDPIIIDNLNNNLSLSTQVTTLKIYKDMISDYNQLYQQLKDKYWKLLEPNWYQLTNTQPEKYIHEDISIATYLILVWRHYKLNIKSFVDLGCGNGLLVFLLNDQGFNGYGIDMRKRKIWSSELFTKSKTKLIESTIDPFKNRFEDCDWIIGNHSDELSPWLPIIANKSSIHKINIFLIPCCLFDLYGKKFDLKEKNRSRYETYLDYLERVYNCCGYKVCRDKLRIPSTKSICFVCFKQENADTKQTSNKPFQKKKYYQQIKN
jgi:SAM-dependent methyltransferase